MTTESYQLFDIPEVKPDNRGGTLPRPEFKGQESEWVDALEHLVFRLAKLAESKGATHVDLTFRENRVLNQVLKRLDPP